MKRKRLTRENWNGTVKTRYCQRDLEIDGIAGTLAGLWLDEIGKPSIWDRRGRPVAVYATGMTWLQWMPRDDHYLLTAMFAPDGALSLWYIDMIAGQGRDPDGVAFIDDLYLDLIVWPDGEIKVDDMDELMDALAQGDITKAQADLALATKKRLTSGPLRDLPALERKCRAMLRRIERAHAEDLAQRAGE